MIINVIPVTNILIILCGFQYFVQEYKKKRIYNDKFLNTFKKKLDHIDWGSIMNINYTQEAYTCFRMLSQKK